MGFKPNNLKPGLALVGIIFLTGAVLHKTQPPAARSNSHLTVPALTYARMDVPPLATKGSFLDGINMSLDPPVVIRDPDPDRASLTFQSDLPAGSFDQLPARLGDPTKSVFTVTNRQLNYKIFGSGDFALKLNLTPAYPRPEAAIPTGLDPGFGISLKF